MAVEMDFRRSGEFVSMVNQLKAIHPGSSDTIERHLRWIKNKPKSTELAVYDSDTDVYTSEINDLPGAVVYRIEGHVIHILRLIADITGFD